MCGSWYDFFVSVWGLNHMSSWRPRTHGALWSVESACVCVCVCGCVFSCITRFTAGFHSTVELIRTQRAPGSDETATRITLCKFVGGEHRRDMVEEHRG